MNLCFYKQVRGGCFPAEIQALPHILTQLDSFLMTPEEAIVEAAATGEVAWLRHLLKRYDCEVPSALGPAAANNHPKCVRILLKKFFAGEFRRTRARYGRKS